MDLDAILARTPQLVLVDELAHTNAPGSRHPKRYLDVEELLAAGIDVYTTVNIQHVESLNDIVAQITRIRVRETVPDSIIDRADDIEVIDITPDDLIQRLKEGKVYVRETASRALSHYFSPGNLTALRELALRGTAQRVDAQLLAHMRANAIAGPWAAGERVLVCISEHPAAAGLVRYAKRLADRLHAPWTAVTIETPRTAELPEAARDRIADTLRLAERLGGEALTLPGGGHTIAEDVLAHARAQNVTQIVIGKTTRSRWFELLHGSVVHDLVRLAGGISVHVIAGDEVAADPIPSKTVRTRPAARRLDPRPYAIALLAVAAAFALVKLIEPLVGIESLDLVFLTAIVGVAVRFGLGPSLLAVAAGSLDLQLLLPAADLHPDDRRARPTSRPSCSSPSSPSSSRTSPPRCAARRRTAQARARTTEALYAFSRKLAGVSTLDEVLWATAYQLASQLDVQVVLLLPDPDGSIAVRAGYPPEDTLEPADIAAAKWSFETNRPAGRGADNLPGARRLFMPLRTGRGAVGVVGLDTEHPGPILTPEQRRLFDALADQAAVAIERVNLVEDVETAMRAAEADRLRQALLTSISHDLRTPLAAIIGAAGTLRDFAEDLDDDGPRRPPRHRPRRGRAPQPLHRQPPRHDPPRVRRHRAQRAPPRTSPRSIGSALQRAARVLADHHVDDRPRRRPADGRDRPGALRAGALQPARQRREVRARRLHRPHRGPARPPTGGAAIRVLDEGDGIPPDEIERVFDKFHRVQKGDRVRAGTGLGLAVCRGFVEAMGGSITAGNRADRSGAVFTVTLPAPGRPARRARRMTAPAVRILVVDDEPPIRRLLRTGLASQGYDVIEAGTAAEADRGARRPPTS